MFSTCVEVILAESHRDILMPHVLYMRRGDSRVIERTFVLEGCSLHA